MNFSDIDNTDRYYKGCEVQVYRFPKDCERKRRWIAAVNRKAWKLGAFSWLCSDHFVNGEKSNDPTSPTYVPSLFAYVASPLKRKAQRDLARYQRIQASKKQRLDMTFQKEEPCQLGSSVHLVVSPQEEKDHMHGTLDNICNLSQAHHVIEEIILVSEITLTPSTSTMTDVSMRDIDCHPAECQLLKQENHL